MKTLFDRPIAHRDDPETSYEAGDKMIKSGALSRQEQEVWEQIIWRHRCYYSDFTARELSNWSTFALDYYTIQRRLSGLRNKGKIERTGEKRDGCCVWKLVKGA